MRVHHPGDYHGVLELFDCFVDFLIRQITEDKLEINKLSYGSRGFCIWLINSKEIDKQIYITLEHDQMRGWSSVTPIEGFEFTLCQGGIVKADLISQYPDEYDKMLELFNAGLDYLQRHDQEHYRRILETVDLSSLERKNWKKSMREIRQELTENIKIRMLTENFERMREQTLANLISKYRGQGYEIVEQ